MSHWIGKLTDKESSKWASRTLSTVCLNIQIDSTRNPSTEFIYLQYFCRKILKLKGENLHVLSIHKYICYMHFYKNAFKRINCINLCKPSIE